VNRLFLRLTTFALLVAAITLAFLDNRGRLCASVGRQGAADIIARFELAALASTDEPFVAFVRLDQFAWHDNSPLEKLRL
jgi:hypothetical protein